MSRAFRALTVLVGIALVLTLPFRVSAAEVEDAEAATHGDEAASYQVVDSYEFPGFKIIQFDLAVLSHYSYMLISGGECLVVDPGRDIFAYVQAARKEGAKITSVWLTHSHADFVAGHLEFAKALGVPLRISDKAGAGYQHIALEENDTFEVGAAVLKFLGTPGHTPDSMCGLVASKQAPDKPLVMLTGDTLFIGSVGRPDLLGENMSAATLASMMFDTWTNKLSKLPDNVMILPAHGAGSLCGAHLSDQPVSTLGEQRASNSYLQHKNRGGFIAAILEGLPDAPQYFQHNAAMNQQGPEPVNWSPETLPTIAPSAQLSDPANYFVIDVRNAQEYADGHIPNSVNIALRGRLETWTGIMVPWDAKAVLTGSEEEVKESLYRLHRVGYQPECLLFDAWSQAGLPLAKNDMTTPQELHAEMQTPDSPVVVDVRLPPEWMALRIGTVVNIPLNELSKKANKLDKTQRIVAVCNSAYRSSLAVGMFERGGFQHVSSMAGGGEAWIEAGLPVFESKATGTVSAAPKREIRLAERASATELKRLMMDLPGTFQLVDIRPPEHFADYHLPGSDNVNIAELLGNPGYLTGAGPLIVVCRDGSLSMMVAGVLSQKTERAIKALYGGLEAYWNEAGPGAGARPVGGGTIPGIVPRTSITAPARQPSECQSPGRGKKRALVAENSPSSCTDYVGRSSFLRLEVHFANLSEMHIMNQDASKSAGGDNGPKPYGNPYVAGLMLGGALLASFLILGAGLGALAVPIRCGAYLENLVAPAHAQASDFFGRKYLGGGNPLRYYLTFMVVGTFLGGLLSAVIARRVKVSVERGRAFGAMPRLTLAVIGGIFVGYASALASGCTSGQALTGGALLANGSIVFMLCVFAGGYAAAYFVRRQWHD